MTPTLEPQTYISTQPEITVGTCFHAKMALKNYACIFSTEVHYLYYPAAERNQKITPTLVFYEHQIRSKKLKKDKHQH